MSETTVTLRKADGTKWKGNKTITKVIIDDDVTEIAEDAFEHCQNLKVVVFSPNSKLKKIGKGAFYKCTALEEVDLPDSVEELKEGDFDCRGAFQYCSSLQKVSLGSNLKIIGYSAFDVRSDLRPLRH